MNALILAALIALGGAGAGAWITRLYYVHEIDQMELKVEADKEVARLKARSAEAQYEAWKATQRPKSLASKAKIEQAIKDDPGCAVQPLPAGLRNAIESSIAESNLPLSDRAVPAARAGSAADVRGRGPRLPGRTH